MRPLSTCPTRQPSISRRRRPPSVLGDEMFEHAQNTTLSKILTCALELSSVAAQQEEEEDGSPDLARNLVTWLKMQDTVGSGGG